MSKEGYLGSYSPGSPSVWVRDSEYILPQLGVIVAGLGLEGSCEISGTY